MGSGFGKSEILTTFLLAGGPLSAAPPRDVGETGSRRSRVIWPGDGTAAAGARREGRFEAVEDLDTVSKERVGSRQEGEGCRATAVTFERKRGADNPNKEDEARWQEGATGAATAIHDDDDEDVAEPRWDAKSKIRRARQKRMHLCRQTAIIVKGM
jgi:hypothetical protein